MNKNIANFWSWFEQNQEKYINFNKRYQGQWDTINQLLDELITELKKYSEGLFVEIGGNETPFELIITPQGVKKYFADALEVVKHAPKIEDWKFFATKPRHESEFNFKMGNVELNQDSISFIPLQNEEAPDDIVIRLFHKDYPEEDGELKNAIIMGIYQCLDILLGEISVTFDINHLEFASTPNENDRILPLKELRGYIKWKKKERDIHGIKFPEDNMSILKGTYQELPVMIIVNRNFKHYEFKSDFPYLLDIDLKFNETQDNGLPAEAMEPIYDFEDKVNQLVSANNGGHYICSETHGGNRRIIFYGDSKERLDGIVERLKQDVQSHQISFEVSYDPFWINSEAYM